MQLLADWCRRQPIAGMTVEIARLEGRTPLLFVEMPGGRETVLLYGHLDKQPEFTGWEQGLGPWEPVIRDGQALRPGRRGRRLRRVLLADRNRRPRGAEDSARALRDLDRGVRGERQSGSAGARRGALGAGSGRRASWCASTPRRATTSGCGSRHRCEETSSARWMSSVLTEGVHSGAGSGIAASCFDVRAHAPGAALRREYGRDQARGAQGRKSRGAAAADRGDGEAARRLGGRAHAVRRRHAADLAATRRCCSRIRPGNRRSR